MLVKYPQIDWFLAKFAQKIPTKSPVFTDCFSAKLTTKISAKSADFSVSLSLKIQRKLIFSTTYQKPRKKFLFD